MAGLGAAFFGASVKRASLTAKGHLFGFSMNRATQGMPRKNLVFYDMRTSGFMSRLRTLRLGHVRSVGEFFELGDIENTYSFVLTDQNTIRLPH